MDAVENQAEVEVQETAKSENQEESCEADEKKEVRVDLHHSQTFRGLTLSYETIMGARVGSLTPFLSNL